MLTKEQEKELRAVCKEAAESVEEEITKFTIPVEIKDFIQMAKGYDIQITKDQMPFFVYMLDHKAMAIICPDMNSEIPAELKKKKSAIDTLREMGLDIPNREMRRKAN